jgi:xylan 1,4-beta-xylosidase
MASFHNPVLGGDRPDPSILKVGDEYWMTYSSFENAPGLPLYRSPDLVTWEFVVNALPHPVGSTFAVDIAEHGGRFFIYIPFIPTPWSTGISTSAIFVIHADSMSGPWSDPIDLGVRGAIDPGHLVGEDGHRYLFVNGIRRIRLSDDGLSTVGELEKVYDGWRYPDDWVTEAYALEGPKLFRRGDWFYLVSAVGGTAGPPTGHMVIVARSRSVHGPWENHPGNPIARTTDVAQRWWSRGHGTIVRGAGDEWWMVTHAYENGFRTLGRQILLEPITWTEEGWPLAPADPGDELDGPVGSTAQGAETGFAGAAAPLRLGERWTFHAPLPDEADRITEEGDTVVLRGKGTGIPDCSPLTHVTGLHAYQAEVELELEGDVEGGVLLFFNSRLFVGMGITGDRMRSYSGGIETHWREPAPPTRRIELRLVNDHHIVTGWYRVPGGEWTRHAIRYETSGYHANTIGDLLSLRPALYAAGSGSVRIHRASVRPLPVDAASATPG